MYFEVAARDIRALPKLEGTVHVNIALIVKFMKNYFFNPAEYADVPRRLDPVNDDFLFRQGATRGLGSIQFHDYRGVYNASRLPNVKLFSEQISIFRDFLFRATPDEKQQKDSDPPPSF